MKKILGTVLGLAFVFSFVTTASAATADDLVGWWKFEENADDSSNYMNNGEEKNNPDYEAGRVGQAIKLDGTDDYVDVSDNDDNSLDMDISATLEAWIKIDEAAVLTGYKNIIRKGHQSDRSYGLDINGNKLRAWVNNSTTGSGAAKIVNGTTVLQKDVWYHVAMIYNNSNVSLYLDGANEGASISASGNLFDNELSLRIGGQPASEAGGALAFKGLIDEVRVWKVALDQESLGFYDDDSDLVLNEVDSCPETVIDEPEELGVNRHVWYSGRANMFTTLAPGKTKNEDTSQFSVEDTNGCSCFQILEKLSSLTGEDYGGHYKFGCSKSVIEDFIMDMNDGELDGFDRTGEPIDTVEATPYGTSADTPSPTYSNVVLEDGKSYLLEASGTYRFASWGEYGIADAAWNYRSASYAPGGVAGWYQQATTKLQLWVDGAAVAWQPAIFNPEHEYTYVMDGDGTNVEFTIVDTAYGDNSGFITVKIYPSLY